jgi:NAD(P)-dependent dehydrogenase (short-subunit alcohol dehydrogenase family)
MHRDAPEYRSMPSSLEGKNILVTGSTAGIGLLAAEGLVRAGANVWVHGRDAQKVERSVQALARFGGAAGGWVADLASLEQTAALARRVVAEAPALDVLVNNAAVGFGSDRQRRELSHDGFELRFAVNYLAPFLLTELLIEQGLPSRAVINVSSIGQEPLDFADLMSQRDYEGARAYRRSKLALIMGSLDLAERHPELVVHALHPGTLLDTNMTREIGAPPRGPASRGAEVICGVVARALERREAAMYFDELSPAPAKPQAYEADARRQLLERSLELTRPFRGS